MQFGFTIKIEQLAIQRIRPLFLSYRSGLTSQTLLAVVSVAILSLKLAFFGQDPKH